MRTSESSFQRCWKIDASEEGLNYSDCVWTEVNKPLTLPGSHDWTKQDIVLFRQFENYIADDMSQKVKVEWDRIKISGLEEGSYILKLLPIDSSIEISALKDLSWKSDRQGQQTIYDNKEGKVYDIESNLYQNITVQSVHT